MPTTELIRLNNTKKKLIVALNFLVDRVEEEISSTITCESKTCVSGKTYHFIWVSANSSTEFTGRSRFYIVLESPEGNGTLPKFYGFHSKCKGIAPRNLNGQPTYCQFQSAPLAEILFFVDHLGEIIQVLEAEQKHAIDCLNSAVKSLESFVPKPWLQASERYPNPYK